MGKQVGTLIRNLREKRGLSQGDVARLLNLKTPQSISNIERGVSPLPRTKIKRLAGILGVKKGEILTVVLEEVQTRVSKAAGVSAKAIVSSDLSSDEYSLLTMIADKFRSAKNTERKALKDRMKKVLGSA